MKNMMTTFLVFILLVFSSCQQEQITDENENKTIDLDKKSAQLVEADNRFGLEIFQKINAEADDDNIMISPLSISVALAMIYNGADGETKSEMEKVLHLNGLTAEEINASYKMLIAALQSLDEDVFFEIANSVFYADDFSVKQPFLNANINSYDAKIEALDFSAPKAVNTINNWVADKTRDKIQQIVDKLNPYDKMVLLNAVYFNGTWSTSFDEEGTRMDMFYKTEDTSFEVPMMNKEDELDYFYNPLVKAIRMPYGTGQYNMVVLLPAGENSSQDVIDELSVENWKSWMAAFEPHDKVVVTMPRFKFEFKTELKKLLAELGMPQAFNPGLSDFTKIADVNDLYISSVLHKSFIDVNETGTEAAAVTSVTVGVTSINPDENQKIHFTVNRPFVFAVTEKDTDAILFMGEVTHPRYD